MLAGGKGKFPHETEAYRSKFKSAFGHIKALPQKEFAYFHLYDQGK